MHLTFKALHLIAMVAWFAGLFYLPRLFVYHVEAPETSHQMLQQMERRLFKAIMTPAMIVTWIFGSLLVLEDPDLLSETTWLPVKLGLVIALTLYHISLGLYAKRLVNNPVFRSQKFFRAYNEVPTLFLLLIILIAVYKP